MKRRIMGGEKRDQALRWRQKEKLILGSESARHALPSPRQLARRLACFDVVCFDVFDTLLLRSVDDPTALLDTTKTLDCEAAHDLIKRTLAVIDDFYTIN